jgi:hypothetical protein
LLKKWGSRVIFDESLLPMTFKQLLFQYGWLNIEATLLNEYPDRQTDLAEFQNVHQALLLLSGADTDLQICVERKADGPYNTFVEVNGIKQTRHIADAQLTIPYSLHYTPWAEWLAMPISAKSFQQFSDTEIIAHCLVEMTYAGFDEETIHAAAEKLSSDIDSMEDENDGLNFTNWEEMLKQLNTKEK